MSGRRVLASVVGVGTGTLSGMAVGAAGHRDWVIVVSGMVCLAAVVAVLHLAEWPTP